MDERSEQFEGSPEPSGRAGRWRLYAAGIAGLALVATLVGLQLVDDREPTPRDARAEVQVKGEHASRAWLEGRITGTSGWRVEVAVVTPDGKADALADPDGHYRVRNLVAGPAEVTWIAESTGVTDGIAIGGSRTGRTQITLSPGRNIFDFAL